MFRLSQVAEVSKGRRMLITKHVVAMPANTPPVDFGRMVQDEAGRMGVNRAAKVYVIMDGGVCLWGVYGDRFENIAAGQLDYYHASQHLHALADAPFPKDKEKDEREARTQGVRGRTAYPSEAVPWSRSVPRTRTASSGADSSGRRRASPHSSRHMSGTLTMKSSTSTR